jgi:hypothetical protein
MPVIARQDAAKSTDLWSSQRFDLCDFCTCVWEDHELRQTYCCLKKNFIQNVLPGDQANHREQSDSPSFRQIELPVTTSEACGLLCHRYVEELRDFISLSRY